MRRAASIIVPTGFWWGVCPDKPAIPGYVVIDDPRSWLVARNLIGEEFIVERTPVAWVLHRLLNGSKPCRISDQVVRVSRLLALPQPLCPAPLRPLEEVLEELKSHFKGFVGVQGFVFTARTQVSTSTLRWGDNKHRRRRAVPDQLSGDRRPNP